MAGVSVHWSITHHVRWFRMPILCKKWTSRLINAVWIRAHTLMGARYGVSMNWTVVTSWPRPWSTFCNTTVFFAKQDSIRFKHYWNDVNHIHVLLCISHGSLRCRGEAIHSNVNQGHIRRRLNLVNYCRIASDIRRRFAAENKLFQQQRPRSGEIIGGSRITACHYDVLKSRVVPKWISLRLYFTK